MLWRFNATEKQFSGTNMLEYTADADLICGQGVSFLRYCSVVNVILWTSLNKARCESSPRLYSLWQFILHFIMPHKQWRNENSFRARASLSIKQCWFDGLSEWFRGRQISLAGCVWVRVTCSRCTRRWYIFRIGNDWFWLSLGLCLCSDAAYADTLHTRKAKRALFLEIRAFPSTSYK